MNHVQMEAAIDGSPVLLVLLEPVVLTSAGSLQKKYRLSCLCQLPAKRVYMQVSADGTFAFIHKCGFGVVFYSCRHVTSRPRRTFSAE